MRGLVVVRFLAFILVAGGLLWLMDNGDSEETPTPSSTPTPAASAPRPTTAPTATELAPEPSAAPEPSEEGVPARSEVQDRRNARIELAERAARAFANPGPGTARAQWWEDLRPQIAERYQSDFDYIDPQEVPYTRVTGAGRHVQTAAPETLLTLVQIPTDVGPYSIEVEDSLEGPRVTAIYPSEE